MQDNQSNDNSLDESADEVVIQETREMGEEIFERYETEANEQQPEDLTPVATAEMPAAEVETEAELPSEDKAAADASNAVLREVIFNEANFEGTVANATPSELVMLMEAIGRENDVRTILPKVPLVKKAFDKILAEKPEAVEAGLTSRLNTAMARFNKKRSEFFAQLEKEKEANTKLKQELLDKLKKIVETEKVTAIQEVREIQNRWKEIGWVAQDQKQAINETYKYFLDLFYSQRGKYNELRDLDRKHNLDEKLRIIHDIESLIPAESDLSRDSWNVYSQKLKNLQEYWRTVGPVPKENVEEINEKLKTALDNFYTLRQEYYHSQDSIKDENGTLKRELLEKLKPYINFTADKAKDWNQTSLEIIAIQEEWKKIGPAPFEVNRELWKEYRAICDSFFERKGAFFKTFDGERTENLNKKIALCEAAEALKENDNFRETAEKLRQYQEEWKKIGSTHERYSNKIWKRFRNACDHFFKRRGEAFNNGSDEQRANLALKNEMLERVKAILESEGSPSEFVEEVKEIQARWKTIGHVPFADKDRINGEFKEAADAFFKSLPARGNSGGGLSGGGKGRGRENNSRSNNYSSSTNSRPPAPKPIDEIDEPDARLRKIKQDISRVKEKLAASKESVANYEINIQMVSKGKSGDGLRNMIQAQVDAEKVFVAKYTAELKALNEKLKAPAPVVEAPVEETPTAETPAVEAAVESPVVAEVTPPAAETADAEPES